jgi:hypothetical protein
LIHAVDSAFREVTGLLKVKAPASPPSKSPGPLVSFYLGEATDDRGRTIEAILSWDYERLESTHDYIQWLFPLRARSGANPDAPTLDNAQEDAFRTDARLKAGLVKALKLMLRFYGFECQDSEDEIDIRSAPDFAERGATWLTRGNHNYLRITRILASLCILGLQPYSRAFMAVLENVYAQKADVIRNSYDFWRRAALHE